MGKSSTELEVDQPKLSPPATRRSLLLGTAAAIVSVNLPAPQARAQQTIGADGASIDGAGFLNLSRALTGHSDVDAVTASRMFAAMSKSDPGFPARANQLARLADTGSEPKALLSAAESVGLRDTALSIVSAWYTGTVGKGPQAVVVSYFDALMYRPVSDGLTVPTYCSYGPLWWTGPTPPAGVTPPAPAAKNG